eukprot:109234-Hanusia_phi.AAC.1
MLERGSTAILLLLCERRRELTAGCCRDRAFRAKNVYYCFRDNVGYLVWHRSVVLISGNNAGHDMGIGQICPLYYCSSSLRFHLIVGSFAASAFP